MSGDLLFIGGGLVESVAAERAARLAPQQATCPGGRLPRSLRERRCPALPRQRVLRFFKIGCWHPHHSGEACLKLVQIALGSRVTRVMTGTRHGQLATAVARDRARWAS
jgi:hypothetical protein